MFTGGTGFGCLPTATFGPGRSLGATPLPWASANIWAASSRAPPKRGPMVSSPLHKEDTRSFPAAVGFCVKGPLKRNTQENQQAASPRCLCLKQGPVVFWCLLVSVVVRSPPAENREKGPMKGTPKGTSKQLLSWTCTIHEGNRFLFVSLCAILNPKKGERTSRNASGQRSVT